VGYCKRPYAKDSSDQGAGEVTRKDYIMIANAVATSGLPERARETLINNLCRGFREDNERFDSIKFAEACRNDLTHSKR
jgi:hypothetical protein